LYLVLECFDCFDSERHSGLGKRGSYDCRVTSFKVNWGCSKDINCLNYLRIRDSCLAYDGPRTIEGVSLNGAASNQRFCFERYIALVRRVGPVQAGPSKFKPMQ
jgi:hypothetical protein